MSAWIFFWARFPIAWKKLSKLGSVFFGLWSSLSLYKISFRIENHIVTIVLLLRCIVKMLLTRYDNLVISITINKSN